MYAKFGGTNKEYYGIFQSGLFINIWEILRRVLGKREMFAKTQRICFQNEHSFFLGVYRYWGTCQKREEIGSIHFLEGGGLWVEGI